MPLASEFHLLDRKGRLLPVRARRCRVLGHQFKLAATSSAPDPVAVPIGEGDRPRNLPRRRQIVVRNSAPLSAVSPNRVLYVGGLLPSPRTTTSCGARRRAQPPRRRDPARSGRRRRPAARWVRTTPTKPGPWL